MVQYKRKQETFGKTVVRRRRKALRLQYDEASPVAISFLLSPVVDRGVVVPQFRLLSARHIVSCMYCDSYALYGSGIRLWRVSVMSRALFRGVALIKK